MKKINTNKQKYIWLQVIENGISGGFNKWGLFFSHDKSRDRQFLGFIQLLGNAIRDPGSFVLSVCSS